MFETAADIRRCADELIEALRDLPDVTGDAWTLENFRRLDAFTREKNPTLTSYHRKHPENAEFLWDFIAVAPQVGVFLAAESEQESVSEEQVRLLKHDFEKLLYVYSPIRVLITKASDPNHAAKLAGDLTSYAQGCCLAFNPGAVFILHFCLWNGAGNISYLWQSSGEPAKPKMESIRFEVVS